MINSNETWQVDVGGEIYETNFEGLVGWIAEGSLMREDKIRRGNLRWLEAGKIPPLEGFFYAKDYNQPMPAIVFSNAAAENETAVNTAATLNNFAVSQQNTVQFGQQHQSNDFNNPPAAQVFAEHTFENRIPPNAGVCSIHNDTAPKYVGDTCQNQFCRVCPKSFGGNVRIARCAVLPVLPSNNSKLNGKRKCSINRI